MLKMFEMQEGKYAMIPEKMTRDEVVRILLLCRLLRDISMMISRYMTMMRTKGRIIVIPCTTKEPILTHRR